MTPDFFGRYRSRKFLLSLLALAVSVPMGIHNGWTADGWAMVLLAILGPHAYANVMETKYGKQT